MNHSKRAQGLPISTIIIAALGLFVLVVIGAIFGGQIGKFGRASSECPGKCAVKDIPTENGVALSGQFTQGTGACDSISEAQLSGAYIARGTQPGKEILSRCSACCVPIG